MAASNTFDTTNLGSAVGNTEELSRMTYLIAPEQAPLLTTITKERATSMNPEWTLDDLADPDDTGTPEGQDVTTFNDEFEDLARVGTFIQTFRRSFKVTDNQELVDSVTPVDYARAEAKAILELNRNCEKRLCGDGVQNAGSKGVARQTDSLGGTISATAAMFPAEYRTPAASIHASGDFTESVLNGLIDSIFTESGEGQNLRLYAATLLRSTMVENFMRIGPSESHNRLNVNIMGESGSVPYKVMKFEGNHGTVDVVDMNPACVPNTSRGYLLNMGYVGIKELQNFKSAELPDLGGGRRGYVQRKIALCNKNPRAHGKVTVVS